MNNLSADADICVKCGLCLPHCPTYTLTQNENESPRGRIALIQAWADHYLDTSEKLIEHIDNCLLDEAANAENMPSVWLFIKCNLTPSQRGTILRRIMRLHVNDNIFPSPFQAKLSKPS